MGWFIGCIAIGLVALGAGYDRRRQRERLRVARAEIHRWEGEGGAVPGGTPSPGTAQSTTH